MQIYNAEKNTINVLMWCLLVSFVAELSWQQDYSKYIKLMLLFFTSSNVFFFYERRAGHAFDYWSSSLHCLDFSALHYRQQHPRPMLLLHHLGNPILLLDLAAVPFSQFLHWGNWQHLQAFNMTQLQAVGHINNPPSLGLSLLSSDKYLFVSLLILISEQLTPPCSASMWWWWWLLW